MFLRKSVHSFSGFVLKLNRLIIHSATDVLSTLVKIRVNCIVLIITRVVLSHCCFSIKVCLCNLHRCCYYKIKIFSHTRLRSWLPSSCFMRCIVQTQLLRIHSPLYLCICWYALFAVCVAVCLTLFIVFITQ